MFGKTSRGKGAKMTKCVILNTKVNFSTKVLEALEELQNDNNDAISMYVDHLDKVSDLLFKIGGDMSEDESKNEIFQMLHENHMLRKDLDSLRATT